jgi:hypothetical protein
MQSSVHADPNLASYTHPTYRELHPYWDFCRDMYRGRSAWVQLDPIGVSYTINPLKAKLYLIPTRDEDGADYNDRLKRSFFKRKFGIAIDAFAGLLSNFTLSGELPQSLSDNINNVDRQGNDLKTFLLNCDINALIDGYCLIYTDFPKQPIDELGYPAIVNAAQEREYNMRPYFVCIEARNVVNWRLSKDGSCLSMVTLREIGWEDEGDYGVKEVEYHRVIYPGYYELFRKHEEGLEPIETGATSLDFIPIVYYSCSTNRGRFQNTPPPLLDLAELNLQLYRKESEKDELMHKCNIPLLQVKEIIVQNPGMPAQRQPKPDKIYVGANTCLWNVEAKYVEPTGSALGLTIEDIKNLEDAMAMRTLEFLTMNDKAQKTATEIVHSAAPLSANLSTMIHAKESNVQQIFEHWEAYLPPSTEMEPEEVEAGISIDEGIIQTAIAPAQIAILLNMRTSTPPQITGRTFLKTLKDGKLFPPDFDIDEELEELAEELSGEASGDLSELPGDLSEVPEDLAAEPSGDLELESTRVDNLNSTAELEMEPA